jgi:hypothetical protein
VAPSAAEGQLVARATKGYGFSLWFTEPAAFACADAVMAPAPRWSVLFHEMAHGVTLNSPARRRIGADVTGCANAVMSESLAQILQHVTAALMANEPSRYGLSEDLAEEVWASAELTAGPLIDGARRYREGGLHYCSWNSPETDDDETLPTFMALAREFLLLADATGDLRGPTRRLMAAIETWGPADAERWQPREAEAFRSTFMVAAVGHALGQDVRTHFRDMGFPIEDVVYTAVQARRMHAAD